MVADKIGGHIAAPAAQSGNLAIPDQIFAVAMMRFVADDVANVMKYRAEFQNQPQLRPHFVERPQLVEK